jgi:LEA14-like dessication related protein
MVSLKKVGVALLAVFLVTGMVVGYFALTFEQPEVTVEDEGDWGTVNESNTEVVTTLAVNNENDYAIKLGNVGADYDLYFNDVRVAEGQKRGVAIPKGESTIELRTLIDNAKLQPWWVEFVEANETIEMETSVTAKATFLGQTAKKDFQVGDRTMLEDRRPVISSMSDAASEAEGRHTVETAADEVGYVIEDGWATYGDVNESVTKIRFHFRVTNPSSTVPVPAEPDGLKANIEMNDVAIVDVEGDDFSAVGEGDDTIEPGETQVVVYEVTMDNEKVDDWFTSHVRNDEVTNVEVTFQMQFEAGGSTVEVPPAGVTYECQFATQLLVDEQPAENTCGGA